MPLLWHTGTVIDGHEYYFHVNNRVWKGQDRGGPGQFHRTMERRLVVDQALMWQRINEVIRRWDHSRYDLFSHNCNYFTQDMLHAIGAGGLDREYIESSGASRFMAIMPGSSTLQEITIKGTSGDLSAQGIAVALWDDTRKVFLPPAIVNNVPGGRAIDKAGDDIRGEAGRAGKRIDDVGEKTRKELGKVTNPIKKLY
jgi:hypothetical protein